MEELKVLPFHFSLQLGWNYCSLHCTQLLGFVCSITAGFIKEKFLYCERNFLSIKSWAGTKIWVPDTAPMVGGNSSGYIAWGRGRPAHSLPVTVFYILTCKKSKTRPTTLKEILSTSRKWGFEALLFQVALLKELKQDRKFSFISFPEKRC